MKIDKWFVRNLRASRGETGEEFAKVLGASPRTVTAWESGYHEPRGLYRKALVDMWEQMQSEEKTAVELSRAEARRVLENDPNRSLQNSADALERRRAKTSLE